jgi:hypothetical protein
MGAETEREDIDTLAQDLNWVKAEWWEPLFLGLELEVNVSLFQVQVAS